MLFFDLANELLSDQSYETENLEGEGETLITYRIDGNKIVDPEQAAVSADLEHYQNDTETHQKIWNYFANMIPLDQRTYLVRFTLFTDGAEETMAAVEQDKGDPRQWILAVDIVDAADPKELTYTLIHEYGHLLTLNPSQVPPNSEIFYNPDDMDLYQQAQEACPRYFTGEGCSNANAYINQFFERFWVDIYDEWFEIDQIEDEDEYYNELDNFYYTHEDQFVTDYAATNPAEDIAESWAYFILKPKPAGRTVAEQKVLFFYEYPELVQLRAQIVSRTYSRLRRN